MTVSYSLDVAKARFCGFPKLLSRWKGGIYKILWREFLIFCFAYALVSFMYRRLLDEEQKIVFEKVVIFVQTFTDLIPLSFVLGFYVSLVIGRWWSQYETIPWPDRLCFMIASYVHGSDERSRMIRRTLGRYVILAQALTFQAVSTSVKRRFPTTEHLVSAGIMTKGEQSVFEKISFPYGKWWIPCHWFTALATRAKKEGRIKDTILLDGLFKEILDYRTSCAIMFGYDWISVPLVYTQVVTIATYAYSLALIVGRQYLDPSKGYHGNDIDLYIPLFSMLQFFFYMGWLKVAEQILNPYGEDDDDFELNWCLDRTVHIVYLIVDKLQLKHPRVSKDFFWDETEPILPQTKHSAKFFIHPQLGSACSLNVDEAEYIPMDALFEEDTEENIYTSDSVKRGGDYRPSLLRRLLSSGSNQSRRRRPTHKDNSVRNNNHPHSQGFSNPAFESNNEKNLVSNLKEPLKSSNSLNNASENSNPAQPGRTSAVSFRPNSLTLHRRKTYDLQDAERLFRQSLPLNYDSDPNEASNIMPVSRTTSAPYVVQFDKSPVSRNASAEEDDGLEQDSDDQMVDDSMPVIPEETSRATSLANIEAGHLRHDETIMYQHSNKEAGCVIHDHTPLYLQSITEAGHVSQGEIPLYQQSIKEAGHVSQGEIPLYQQSNIEAEHLNHDEASPYQPSCIEAGHLKQDETSLNQQSNTEAGHFNQDETSQYQPSYIEAEHLKQDETFLYQQSNIEAEHRNQDETSLYQQSNIEAGHRNQDETSLYQQSNIEAGHFKQGKTPIKRLKDVHYLVKEANEALRELNRAILSEDSVRNLESKGYESCCSGSNVDSSEDEMLENEETRKKETSVVIELEKDNEQEVNESVPPSDITKRIVADCNDFPKETMNN